VDVRVVDANDDLVNGIMTIFNEIPVRQGKKFWHYGKGFETVKKEILLADMDRSDFIGAFYEKHLIGFIKLIYTKEYASFAQILSMIKYRDMSPTNALVAKAVEICAARKIPYLVYGNYDYGKTKGHPLSEFKRRNGFNRIDVPRYYIPLTIKGKIALKFNLHHGILRIIPEKLKVRLKNMRKHFYTRKYLTQVDKY
jgi:hypothetical protein